MTDVKCICHALQKDILFETHGNIGSVPAPPDFSRYGRFLEASFLEPLERFLEVAGGS